MSQEYKIEAFCQKCQKYGHIANFCESYISFNTSDNQKVTRFSFHDKILMMKITGNQIMYSRKVYANDNINSVIALEA